MSKMQFTLQSAYTKKASPEEDAENGHEAKIDQRVKEYPILPYSKKPLKKDESESSDSDDTYYDAKSGESDIIESDEDFLSKQGDLSEFNKKKVDAWNKAWSLSYIYAAIAQNIANKLDRQETKLNNEKVLLEVAKNRFKAMFGEKEKYECDDKNEKKSIRQRNQEIRLMFKNLAEEEESIRLRDRDFLDILRMGYKDITLFLSASVTFLTKYEKEFEGKKRKPFIIPNCSDYNHFRAEIEYVGNKMLKIGPNGTTVNQDVLYCDKDTTPEEMVKALAEEVFGLETLANNHVTELSEEKVADIVFFSRFHFYMMKKEVVMAIEEKIDEARRKKMKKTAKQIRFIEKDYARILKKIAKKKHMYILYNGTKYYIFNNKMSKNKKRNKKNKPLAKDSIMSEMYRTYMHLYRWP